MTKFESIHQKGLHIADMEQIPEIAQDTILKLIADEQSMIEMTRVINILMIISPEYADFFNKSYEEAVFGLAASLLEALKKKGL